MFEWSASIAGKEPILQDKCRRLQSTMPILQDKHWRLRRKCQSCRISAIDCVFSAYPIGLAVPTIKPVSICCFLYISDCSHISSESPKERAAKVYCLWMRLFLLCSSLTRPFRIHQSPLLSCSKFSGLSVKTSANAKPVSRRR